MVDLTDLIARCESAGESEQRELLLKAWAAIGPSMGNPYTRFTAMLEAKAYLSAAEMLVPEECHFLMAAGPNGNVCDVHTAPLGSVGEWRGHSRASTPALALLAASLRAMEKQG